MKKIEERKTGDTERLLLEKTLILTAIMFLTLGVSYITTILIEAILLFVVSAFNLICGILCHVNNRKLDIKCEEKYKINSISWLIAIQVVELFRNLLYSLEGARNFSLSNLLGGSFLSAFQLFASTVLIIYLIIGKDKLAIFVFFCLFLLSEVISIFLEFNIVNLVKILVFAYLIIVQLSTIIKYSEKVNIFLKKIQLVPLLMVVFEIILLVDVHF